MTQTFASAYNDVYCDGLEQTVRGAKVSALYGITIGSPDNVYPHRVGCNPAIGLIEGLQFIAGTAELSAIKAVAPNAKHDLFGLNSFYGPRTAAQFPRVVDLLNEQRSTRQAVVMVTHPDDSPETIPCTLAVQFQIGKYDALQAQFTMRSSDMVWGMPYDLIQFGMVTQAIKCCTGCSIGDVIVHTANAHIYDATSVRPTAWAGSYFVMPEKFETWNAWRNWAKEVVYSELSKEKLLKMFGIEQ